MRPVALGRIAEGMHLEPVASEARWSLSSVWRTMAVMGIHSRGRGLHFAGREWKVLRDRVAMRSSRVLPAIGIIYFEVI